MLCFTMPFLSIIPCGSAVAVAGDRSGNITDQSAGSPTKEFLGEI